MGEELEQRPAGREALWPPASARSIRGEHHQADGDRPGPTLRSGRRRRRGDVDRFEQFPQIVLAQGRRDGRLAGGVQLLIQQVANASGGPVTYTGSDMKSVHAGLHITMSDFNALVEDLVAALDKNGVSMAAKQTLLGALAPMASDIVTA